MEGAEVFSIVLLIHQQLKMIDKSALTAVLERGMEAPTFFSSTSESARTTTSWWKSTATQVWT